ncbi:MAG: M81 family metallopeptidase [Kofleriaceae bacterium]|nr:M81 family metallopeptidase [Kofleriaceae bacterium]
MASKAQSTLRPLRIAYGRIFHEGCSYSPLLTEREQFESAHYYEGADLEKHLLGKRHELVDILKKAELRGALEAAENAKQVECVPLLSALAVPSGPISEDCFSWLRENLKRSLQNMGEVDGVYLAMHGSMRVENLERAPEAVLLEDIRAIIGDTPLAISYDLHANLSPGTVDPSTILEGFRTNPHRDLRKTGVRAMQQLIATLRSQITPVRAWRKLPITLGGGTTIDFFAPMRQIFRHIKSLCNRPDVISAHLFMVHPYTNAKDLGWAVHVCTDGDQALADKLADELAEMAWVAGKFPLPEFRSASAAIAEVRKSRLSRKLGHISLVDTGDVVGAGSTGGVTHLLSTLVAEGSDLKVLLPLHDPAVVEELWSQPLEAVVQTVLRGTPGLESQPEVALEARLMTKLTTEFGRSIVLKYKAMHIAVTEQPPSSVHPKFWRELGLSPWKADVIVQKFFFHYRMFYVASCRKNIPVSTPGPTCLDSVRARKFDPPVWPSDPVQNWRNFDEIHRINSPLL